MRTDERRGAAAARCSRAIFTTAAVVTLAGCAANLADQQAAASMEALTELTEPVPTRSAASVAPQPVPPTTEPDDAFVERCVEHILFTSYIGDAASQARWEAAGYDKSRLRENCAMLAEADAAARSTFEQEMDALDAFFAAAAAAEVEEAERQGQALLDRLCGGSGGWYRYELTPVRVWLDRCNSPAGTGGSLDSGERADRDCEQYGYASATDPSHDPAGLDTEGIDCEGR
jgi:hypothetical protein